MQQLSRAACSAMRCAVVRSAVTRCDALCCSVPCRAALGRAVRQCVALWRVVMLVRLS